MSDPNDLWPRPCDGAMAMEEKASSRTTSSLIAYVCMAQGHPYNGHKDGDHLTIHQRAWAFCGADVKEPGHEWRPTGGVDLTSLLSGLRHGTPLESASA